MLSTLNPACPLCGLRFENKPLLDLHIRDDHRQRVSRERNGDSDPGSTRAPASGAESLPDPADPAAAKRGRADWTKTVLRRALHALHKSPANHGAHQAGLWASSHTAAPARSCAPSRKPGKSERGPRRPDEPALIDSPSGYHSACTYQGLYVLAVVQDLPDQEEA
jgi:hypothetical protein